MHGQAVADEGEENHKKGRAKKSRPVGVVFWKQENKGDGEGALQSSQVEYMLPGERGFLPYEPKQATACVDDKTAGEQ